MRLTRNQINLLNLAEKVRPDGPVKRIYMPKEEAYEELKANTGQDFGYDAVAWAKYLYKTEDFQPGFYRQFFGIGKFLGKLIDGYDRLTRKLSRQ